MRDRRHYFKKIWEEGHIEYEDIPKSFRPGRTRTNYSRHYKQ